ncbi:MAG: class II fructose-bisphosphate aldolase, partial [Candidatus Margulisiibacteriota bacterium]
SLSKKEDYTLQSKAHKLFQLIMAGSPEEIKEAVTEINALAARAGIASESIQDHYADKSRGKSKYVTVPAINGRQFTHLLVYAALEANKKLGTSKNQPVIFELAKSESGYTGQSAEKYTALVKLGYLMAGARNQKIYVQGDHFQVDRVKFWQELAKAGFVGAKSNLNKEEISNLDAVNKAQTADAKLAYYQNVTKFLDQSAAVKEIVNLSRDAIKAGYRNIDIDSSVLERLTGTPFLKQEWNGLVCAYLISKIRQMEKELDIKKTLSLGGEVGEIGKDSTSKEDFEAYFKVMKDYLAYLGKDLLGPSKFAVTTGTAHGGVRDPKTGQIMRKVPIRFDILQNFSDNIKNPWVTGASRLVTVQHGASTLDPELYKGFAAIGVGEVHLATEYQLITLNVLKEKAPEVYKKMIANLLNDETISSIKSQKAKYPNCKTDLEVQKKFLADKDTMKGIGGPKENIKLLMSLKPEVYHEITRRLNELFEKQFINLRLNKGSAPLSPEEEKIAKDVIDANKAQVKVKTVASED